MYTKVYETEKELPKVVCLCGSTLYRDGFLEMQAQETLAGNIVMSVGYFSHDPGGSWDAAPLDEGQKVELDELHKRKIDFADEILVINVNGYIGSSTQSEVAYCRAQGKPVRYRDVSFDNGESWVSTHGVPVWVNRNDSTLECSLGQVIVDEKMGSVERSNTVESTAL